MAHVFCSKMGMALVILQKPRLQEKERAIATARTTTFATAKFAITYGELLLKRRGLRGLLRLAFTLDMRNTFYKCAGGKWLLNKHGLNYGTIF